jgi:hypothetical protein
MSEHISADVFILTGRDLDDIKNKSFQRGVERGRLEERIAIGKEPVALNCANWKDGRCESCGAQWQDMEVSGDFKCPHFTRRATHGVELRS